MAKVKVTITAADPNLIDAGKPCKQGDEIEISRPAALLLLRKKLISKIPGESDQVDAPQSPAPAGSGKRAKTVVAHV